jgi:UDP-galactopyranose mutase
MLYDYIIVGSGLFGAVFAYEAKKKNKKCLVIDKRNHVGGNIYCENVNGINVHKYGPHIFHTNDREIWNYVNNLVEFNRFTYSPIANYNGQIFNLPFNMNTFYQLWKVTTPEEADQIIKKQIAESGIITPTNLEEQAISLVGFDIYEKLIKGYSEKQWGRLCKELPSFIIKRLPVRFTYDNNYFNDKYQGIPIGGYNKIIEKLLEGIEVRTNTDYFSNRNNFDSITSKVVYTGKLDLFFDYDLGQLEYRGLRFETERLNISNFQGNAGVNYTSSNVPFTRIVEHKHFEFGTQDFTVITREYSLEANANNEPYYPINDFRNEKIANEYRKRADNLKNIIFGGRLAEYKYYDMHQIIGSALHKSKSI